MSTVVVNSPLSNPANALAYNAPVPQNLVLWSFMNAAFVSVANGVTTLKNLAAQGATGSIMSGAPTIGASYISFHGGLVSPLDYFTTAFTDTGGDLTLMALFRSTDSFTANTNDPKLVSNTASGAGPGASLEIYGTASGAPQANMRMADYNTSGTGGTSAAGPLSIANATGWHFVAGTRVAATGVRTIYDITDGTSVIGSHPGTINPNTANPFWIGANPNLAAGICDIAFAGIHQGLAETLTQLQAERAAVLAYTSGLAAPITGY